mgnify:CR=1 FL=1
MQIVIVVVHALFLSTLSLRRATSSMDDLEPSKTHFYPRSPCGERQATNGFTHAPPQISIHALLAESDRVTQGNNFQQGHFYPRSPCGERRATKSDQGASNQFLSTLSLRRATHYDNYNLHCVEISIHALLAESDGSTELTFPGFGIFLSTLSLRRAT